jgi:hypothetical protein
MSVFHYFVVMALTGIYLKVHNSSWLSLMTLCLMMAAAWVLEALTP